MTFYEGIKVSRVNAYSRKHGHPLQCVMEKQSC